MILIREGSEERKELYTAFMDLEKEYEERNYGGYYTSLQLKILG